MYPGSPLAILFFSSLKRVRIRYLLALNLVWLIYPSGAAVTQRVREVIIVDVLAAVLYLPWLPTFFRQIERIHSFFWVQRPTVGTLFLTGALIAGFNLDYLAAVAARLLPLSAHSVWLCVLVAACLLSAALIAGGFWRAARAEKMRNFSLLSYCLLPILAVFAVSRVATPVFIDRIFIASSAVLPIVFAFPLAAQRGRRSMITMLYRCLGIVLAAATALSVFGFQRYQQKEDYRGAISFLLAIPESNRLIVFLSRSDKDLFDYYSQRVPARVPGVVGTALRWSFLEQFPPPAGQAIDAIDISPVEALVGTRLFRSGFGSIASAKRSESSHSELYGSSSGPPRRTAVHRNPNHPIYTVPALRTQKPVDGVRDGVANCPEGTCPWSGIWSRRRWVLAVQNLAGTSTTTKART